MSMSDQNRRDFIKRATGLILAPSLPMIPGIASSNTTDIVVGTWGGDYQSVAQRVIKPLAESRGVNPIYSTGNATSRNTRLKAEINSRRGSMDVAMLGDLHMHDANTAGALAQLSPDMIPNMGNTIDTFQTSYSIPHIFTAMVLVYNKEKVPSPPTSFNDALDPACMGRVGFSDILYNYSTIFVGLAEGGKGESFEPGYKFLRKLKENKPKVFPSNEAVAAAFKSEEIWMACMWKARALQWRDAGLPLEFVIPEEGGIATTFEAAIPKNSRNKEAAAVYLNALLEPEGQIEFARAMGYTPTVKDVVLPPDLQDRVGFSPEELARIHPYDLEILAAQRAATLDFWNKEFKSGL